VLAGDMGRMKYLRHHGIIPARGSTTLSLTGLSNIPERLEEVQLATSTITAHEKQSIASLSPIFFLRSINIAAATAFLWKDRIGTDP